MCCFSRRKKTIRDLVKANGMKITDSAQSDVNSVKEMYVKTDKAVNRISEFINLIISFVKLAKIFSHVTF